MHAASSEHVQEHMREGRVKRWKLEWEKEGKRVIKKKHVGGGIIQKGEGGDSDR